MADNYQTNKDKYTFEGPNGEELILDYSGLGITDAYRTADFGRRGKKTHAAQYIEYFLKHGKEPSKAYAKENFGFKSDGAYNNLANDLNVFLEENNLSKEDVVSQIQSGAPNELEDNKFLASRMFQEGSEENSIYQIALEAQKAQAQTGERETARSERDMQMQLSQSRQELMNEVRNRRRNMLKSGLSSAQVANEEMQSLLMGQQQAAQIAQQHYGQRQQYQQQAQNAPQNAAMQVLGMLPEHGQIGAQFAAAEAGDLLTQAEKYAKRTGSQFTTAVDAMKTK